MKPEWGDQTECCERRWSPERPGKGKLESAGADSIRFELPMSTYVVVNAYRFDLPLNVTTM